MVHGQARSGKWVFGRSPLVLHNFFESFESDKTTTKMKGE